MTLTKTSQIELSFEPLALKTSHPFGISYGTSSDTNNVLVKLKMDGVVGYGEAAPASYHGEKQNSVLAVLEMWREANFLGDDPFAIAQLAAKLDKSIAGHAAAKAAVEMAMHDLAGKVAGCPTYNMLGLSNLTPPITDFTIGIDNLEMIEKKTKEAVEAGYKVLKVKQGTTYDRDIIRAVRKVAPNTPLRVDANGAWTPKQAIEMAKFLSEQNVQFIEQPLPKHAPVEEFAFVRQRSPLPIFADESIMRANDVARFAGTVDGVVVKIAKTGGILEALKVIHTARAHGMEIMFGCMVESSLGISAAAQLQTLVDYLDLDGALLLANDPFKGLECKEGILQLSGKPGLGVEM